MTTAELTKTLDESELAYNSEECDSFDRMLKSRLSALTDFERNIKRWEDAVRSGKAQFSFAFEQELTSRYRKWVLNARLCLRQLDLQEEKDCLPESADEFREAAERAEETLLLRTQDEVAAKAALRDAE